MQMEQHEAIAVGSDKYLRQCGSYKSALRTQDTAPEGASYSSSAAGLGADCAALRRDKSSHVFPGIFGWFKAADLCSPKVCAYITVVSTRTV